MRPGRRIRAIEVAALAALLAALVVAAPGASAQWTTPAAWIDAPLNGSRLPVAPLTVVAHATDAAGVASLELFVDGVRTASASGSAAPVAHAEFAWAPTGPGGHYLVVQGVGSDGSRSSSTFTFVFIGDVSATPSPSPAVTSSPSATPSPPASAPPTPAASSRPTPSSVATPTGVPTPTPDVTKPTVQITIDPTAPTTADLITLTATAHDAGGIASIEIWTRYEPTSGGLHLFGRDAVCTEVTTCVLTRGPYGSSPGPGQLSYYAIARDFAGNLAGTATYSVDVTAPIIP